ncbi:Rab-GTPase-TBC [Gracilaria domingensis]|nr:Rab-GTPase-TBC [Gracilaria domingensis]
MAVEHVGEHKHALRTDGEVGGLDGSNERLYGQSNGGGGRNGVLSFLATYVFGPARRRWFTKKTPDELEVEEDCVSRQQSATFKVPFFALEEDRSFMKSPRSQICSRIPNVASQTQKMDLLLLDERPRLEMLKKTAWNGCSSENRAQVWRLLLGYEPLEYKVRSNVLGAKRTEYWEYVNLFCQSDTCPDFHNFGRFGSSESQCLQNEPVHLCEQKLQETSLYDEPVQCRLAQSTNSSHFGCRTLRQINLDLPRTHPDVPIFHVAQIRNIMRRVLFLYSMLNPGRSYVQGMNEILTPLVVVYVNDLMKISDEKGVEDFLKRSKLPPYVHESNLDRAEADIFWVFTYLVSSVQDNFVSEQPGMLRRISRLQKIVSDVDPALATHLTTIEVEFLQFAYRWMNCLLMRELPLPLVIRVWDALLAEDDGISDLHVYLCAALLIHFSEILVTMDFEEAILFLQHLPTSAWTVSNIDDILSQAYQWKEALGFKSLSAYLSNDPCVIGVKGHARVS